MGRRGAGLADTAVSVRCAISGVILSLHIIAARDTWNVLLIRVERHKIVVEKVRQIGCYQIHGETEGAWRRLVRMRSGCHNCLVAREGIIRLVEETMNLPLQVGRHGTHLLQNRLQWWGHVVHPPAKQVTGSVDVVAGGSIRVGMTILAMSHRIGDV